MKKKLLVFFITFLLIFNSCAGTPQKETKPPAPKPPASVQPEPVKGSEEDTPREEEIEQPAPESDEIEEIADAAGEQSVGAADYNLEINFPTDEEIETYIENAEAQAFAEETPVTQTLPPLPPPAPPLVEAEPEGDSASEEIVQQTPLSNEDSDESIAETPREIYRPDFPPGPAHTPDSLLQMGLTPLDREIIYSRIIHATVGQIAEIPFRGNGWIYLGEIASRRGIVYSSRRNDTEGQSFIFTLEAPGTYTLKFYRQDFIRDYIINDHVQVIVTEAPSGSASWQSQSADRSRVVAQPRWPTVVEEAQIRSGARIPAEPFVTTGDASTREAAPAQTPSRETSAPAQRAPSQETQPARIAPAQPTVTTQPQSSAQSAQPPAAATLMQSAQSPAAAPQPSVTQPQVQTAPPVPANEQSQPLESSSQPSAAREIMSHDEAVKKAQENFEAANAAQAIALLEQFVEDHPGGSDEVYWRLGQYYEANTSSRNILLSRDYYRRLVNEYPQSSRFNDARRRIAYLERFYINIQ